MPQITKEALRKEFMEYYQMVDKNDFFDWFYSKLTQSQEEARRDGIREERMAMEVFLNNRMAKDHVASLTKTEGKE